MRRRGVSSVPMDAKLTKRLKAVARRAGADFVGIAPIERFQQAPKMTHPDSILPGANAVVVIGAKYPDASIDRWCKPPAESMFFYQSVQAYMTVTVLPMIQFRIYRFLEQAGHLALPIAPSGYWRYRDYKAMKGGFIADFSHRHAAVAAGLGEIGLNGLFVSQEFGVRQRLASVITTAPLAPDPLYLGAPLCDECGGCLRACPVHALSETETVSVKIGEKQCKYAKLDKWRCAWVEQIGMVGEAGPKYEGYTTDVPPPEQITPEDYIVAKGKRDPFQAGCEWGTISCGRCLHTCNSHKRKHS